MHHLVRFLETCKPAFPIQTLPSFHSGVQIRWRRLAVDRGGWLCSIRYPVTNTPRIASIPDFNVPRYSSGWRPTRQYHRFLDAMSSGQYRHRRNNTVAPWRPQFHILATWRMVNCYCIRHYEHITWNLVRYTWQALQPRPFAFLRYVLCQTGENRMVWFGRRWTLKPLVSVDSLYRLSCIDPLISLHQILSYALQHAII